MAIKTTKEQQKYIKERGQIILNACPGSGKTTVIGYKLFELVNSWDENNSHYSGIACLSFTNVAKDEINEKFKAKSGRSLSYPHIVSTIDSFINRYITLPYSYLVFESEKRPSIVEGDRIIDQILQNQPNLQRKFKQFLWRYLPSSIEFDKNGELFSTIGDPHSRNFAVYCNAVKDWQLKNRVLKTTDSAFFALAILNDYPKIAKWLIQRFPYIIIDEAQDTSEIQDAIFNKLIEEGLQNIELVGDPYQAIFEWRDARPDLFIDKVNNDQWNTLPLTENKRSTQIIADTYCRLRCSGDPKIVCTSEFKKTPPVIVFKYDENDLESLATAFKELCNKEGFKDNAIVARGKGQIKKILGKKDVFPWKSDLPYGLLRARKYLDNKATKKAINEARKATTQFLNPDDQLAGLTEKEEQIIDYQNNAFLFKFLVHMPTSDKAIEEWTQLMEDYFIKEFGLNEPVEFGIKRASRGPNSKYRPEDKGLPVHTLVEDLDHKGEMKVSTIHQVKGMTFDALLLVLSKDSRGQSISLNNITEPDGIPDERQRLIYVAMSRPTHLLALGVPKSVGDDLIKGKLGSDVVIEEVDV